MKKLLMLLPLLVTSLFLVQCQSPGKKSPAGANDRLVITSAQRTDHQSAEASGNHFAVSTQGIYATQAAKIIYEANGNIIDVAVAISFAISVERPHSTGIGGGGFMLFREQKTKKTYAIDFRERAPLKSTKDMFLNVDGTPNSELSQNGILSAAVPGIVAGLLDIHAKFGKLPLAKVMNPAIELAENGFPIYPSLKKALDAKESYLKKDPAARAIFLDKDQKAWPEGHILVQKDLAKTLRKIAKSGKNIFYKGEIAKSYVKFFKEKNGLLSKDDLSEYQVKWRTPVKGSYKEYEIFSMPPPSSGGIHVVQFLNLLEKDNLKEKGLMTAESIHLEAASLQAAFADRAQYLGDPDFINVPVDDLTSKAYAEKRRAQFPKDKARPSSAVKFGNVTAPYESTETTHFSILDEEGNAVSSTQTINGYMGASMVVPGTGIVINNEMDDFSAKPGASNLFGAIGSTANSIVPKKTPLSSMSPTILTRDDIPVMAIGAPGGTRIISCVAQSILNYIEFKLPLYESIASIRYHHQWLPDVLELEPPGPGADVIKKLTEMGYNVEVKGIPCNVMAATHEGTIFKAVSDPRDIGTSFAN